MSGEGPVWVCGSKKFLGAAVLRALEARGTPVLPDPRSGDADVTDPDGLTGWLDGYRPSTVIVAAGRSGGIHANQREPASLMLDNLRVVANVLPAAFDAGVRKLVYLSSSCVYPREAPQPIRPESLLSGPLEPTNQAYALAKLAGMGLVRAYRQEFGAPFVCAVPTSGYGPGDDFSPENSHVAAALVRRIVDAADRGDPEVVVWGTGSPRREFLHVDDLARAVLAVHDRYDGDEPIHLGSGEDVSIRELAGTIARLAGYRGRLVFDATKPDGMPRKSLDGSALAALGWKPRVELAEGLAGTIEWYRRSRPT